MFALDLAAVRLFLGAILPSAWHLTSILRHRFVPAFRPWSLRLFQRVGILGNKESGEKWVERRELTLSR